jgi:eukaryotic-like serine/threonine-protein kinase
MSTNPGHIDKYELQQSLGQNGITEVWKAFDTQARRYVAIKLFHAQLKTDPDFMTRFQREAQVIVSLRHSNIVPSYNFSISQFPETSSAMAYLVMDYIEGGTLADYTRNATQTRKLLPIPAIIQLFSSIGLAIEFAHQQHVIHGNLKPTNILLDKQNTARSPIGEPMVTDFDMAGLMGTTGGNAGTWWNSSPLYISPEQVMGAPANERSDIYSLGIMLYEICTGTLPFLGNSAEAIMMQQVNTIPASPSLINPNLPPALSTVIMRCIAKDPAARFPSASAMVAALVDVNQQGSFNMPAHEIVGQSSGPFNSMEMDMPTVISTRMSPLPAGVVSSGPMYSSQAQVGGISQPYPVVQSGGPITPLLPGYTPAYSTGNQAVGISMPPPTAPSAKKPGRRGLYIVLAALLILALIGSALGAYFAFFSKGTPTTTTTTPQIVGHAYFVSSGFVSPYSRQGITDQLQINLENVSAAPLGKSYYAWLLNDITLDWRPIYLGQLAFNNGTLSLFYAGDAVHSNLLATNSRFLITEEDASAAPSSPSLDPKAWVYYAEFSQIKPVPTDPTSYSVYDHIRHLLADDPKVKAAGLTGGLDIWLYRNTQKVLEWAGSARDAWKTKGVAFIHRQLARIMDYLDGTLYVKKDLPGLGLYADPNISKVGLLTFDPQTQNPPGYLYHIGKHLHEITALPQTSAAQRELAIQINQSIDVVNLWMRNIRDDVLKLYAMPDAHLTGNDGLTLLDEVATLANEAFAGKVDVHDQVTNGVVQIHYDIQRLATFDVRACTASNPCAIS